MKKIDTFPIENIFIKRWAVRILFIGLMLIFSHFIFQAFYFYKKFDKSVFELNDEQKENQTYDLTVIPTGKVIWIRGIGEPIENTSKEQVFKHKYYHVAIFNPYDNILYRITVPDYVAVYLSGIQSDDYSDSVCFLSN